MKKYKALLLAALVLITAIFAAACARAAKTAADEAYYMETTSAAWGVAQNKADAPAASYNGGYAYDAEMEAPMEEEYQKEELEEPSPTDGEPDTELPGFAESKLIYTCYLTIQTTAFDETVNNIHDLIGKFGGFIASESRNDNDSYWYRTGYVKTNATLSERLTVRVPAENYYAFLDAIEGNGKIISKDMNVENISRQYADTETTIKSLETQEQRLLDMMAQCETVEDMITVEARLSEVQNELKMYRNRLSGMDTDVAYSTITMNIYEVLEYTPDKEPVKVQTFGDRLKNTLKETGEGFMSFLEGFLFIIISALPYLLIIAAIVVLIIWLVRRNRKKNGGNTRPARPVQPERRPADRLPEKKPVTEADAEEEQSPSDK